MAGSNYKSEVAGLQNTSWLCTFVSDVRSNFLNLVLPRPEWVKYYGLRPGVGHFRSSMFRWGLVPSAVSKCGTKKPSPNYTTPQCSKCHDPNETKEMTKRFWMIQTFISPCIALKLLNITAAYNEEVQESM